MVQAGGGVFPLPEQLPGAVVDKDRLAGRPLDEEDAGRQVGHQGMEHARCAAQIDGQRPLFRHVRDHAFPAAQPALGVKARRQHVADPTRGEGRRRTVWIIRKRVVAFAFRGSQWREAVLARHRLILPAQLRDGRQNDFVVFRMDVLEPALVIAEQLFRGTVE
jgi:hypothetical protein